VLLFGPVSSGKTWLLSKWIESIPRSLTIDATAAFMDGRFSHMWHSPKDLLLTLEQNPYSYRISYHPSSRNFTEDCNWCAKGIWLSYAFKEGAMVPLSRWLIVDEVHEVCGIDNISYEMETVIRYARHNLVGFIGATHRFADLDKRLTQSARVVVLFHTTEGIDLEAIRKRYGKAVEDAVRKLRPCIYDEVQKVVHQEPQCLVYMRGMGYNVYDLGDKILTGEVPKQWQAENVLADQQKVEVPRYSELTTGNREQLLEEPIPEPGNPQ
jgi:hypothetical protein